MSVMNYSNLELDSLDKEEKFMLSLFLLSFSTKLDIPASLYDKILPNKKDRARVVVFKLIQEYFAGIAELSRFLI